VAVRHRPTRRQDPRPGGCRARHALPRRTAGTRPGRWLGRALGHGWRTAGPVAARSARGTGQRRLARAAPSALGRNVRPLHRGVRGAQRAAATGGSSAQGDVPARLDPAPARPRHRPRRRPRRPRAVRPRPGPRARRLRGSARMGGRLRPGDRERGAGVRIRRSRRPPREAVAPRWTMIRATPSRRTPMHQPLSALFLGTAVALLSACGGQSGENGAMPAAEPAAKAAATAPAGDRSQGEGFDTTELASFDHPWAMTFLPDGRLLVTEMGGRLKLFDPATGATGDVGGVPEVRHAGQGGFGDVVLHPGFADNRLVYISYVEAGDRGLSGSAVARARLALDEAGGGALEDLEVIWRQQPKLDGNGHFGQRIAFGPDGMLWISSSERQHFDPAQDMATNLGKIVRLHDDGSVPADNPFA